jgi:hypothetical protein
MGDRSRKAIDRRSLGSPGAPEVGLLRARGGALLHLADLVRFKSF